MAKEAVKEKKRGGENKKEVDFGKLLRLIENSVRSIRVPDIEISDSIY